MTNQRYIEISYRNPASKVWIGGYGAFTSCMQSGKPPKIEIRRATSHKCKERAKAKNNCACYTQTCGCNDSKCCDTLVATVTASKISSEGEALFEWPVKKLLKCQEGWYQGFLIMDCNECSVLPIRIGQRCNVAKVEEVVLGPDCVGPEWITCDSDCFSVCGNDEEDVDFYQPEYEI